MDLSREIMTAAAEAGILLDEATTARLSAHLDAVLSANKEFNLTAITNPRDAVLLHVVDSILCMPTLLCAPAGRCVDIGSGAGFPGISLAICTGRQFLLVESVKKKASFLATVVDDLDLASKVVVVPKRAEAYARDCPESCSVVLARAVTSIAALLELASPLLVLGGWLVAMKGAQFEEELREAEACAALVGMSFRQVDRLELPRGAGSRSYCVYEKTSSALVTLPRREGLAQRRPLR